MRFKDRKRIRLVLFGLGVLGLLTVGIGKGALVEGVGGAYTREPEALHEGLSAAAAEVLKDAYAGLELGRITDHHTHVVGLGTKGTGAWVNPAMQSWLSPFHRLQFEVYASAAGITDLADADAQYFARLMRLIGGVGHPGRFHILAFDYAHHPGGTRNPDESHFHIPNEYVFELAGREPERLIPVMSVHPYREDAIEALDTWAAKGGRLIKWLPNAMGIDASDPRLDPYYDRVRTLDLTILTHVGEEKAVEAEEGQKLGNPLLFRRPLDQGVRIIMAHCASLGENEDLDNPGQYGENFDFFLRLMDEPKYEGHLFGEISALTQFNRAHYLERMLDRTDLHRRLVNGSDYPLPAINIVLRTSVLEEAELITAEQRDALNQIYDHNPLLFDFVVKRTLKSRAGNRFAPEVFYGRTEWMTQSVSP